MKSCSSYRMFDDHLHKGLFCFFFKHSTTVLLYKQCTCMWPTRCFVNRNLNKGSLWDLGRPVDVWFFLMEICCTWCDLPYFRLWPAIWSSVRWGLSHPCSLSLGPAGMWDSGFFDHVDEDSQVTPTVFPKYIVTLEEMVFRRRSIEWIGDAKTAARGNR